jgi:MFS family permease
MLIIGMALFGLASLISYYAQTPAELICARAAMGLGGAAVMPQTLSIITNVFDPKERPKAIGICASTVGVAIAVGPVTGGLLFDHFWWGSAFLINVPLTAVGVAAIALLVPESRRPAPGWITPACCSPSPDLSCSSTGSSGAATRHRGWSPA